MNCATCGCYIPETMNICPACGNKPNVKIIEKIVYKTVERSAESFDYVAFFNNEPMIDISWFETPKNAPEKYEKLKLILTFIITQYPPFRAMDIHFIRSKFKAVSNVSKEIMEYALNDLVKEKVIDVYHGMPDYWCLYYARLPKTNEECKRKKKHYNRSKRAYLFPIMDKEI